MDWQPPLSILKKEERHPPLECRKRNEDVRPEFIAQQKGLSFWWTQTWELYCLVGKLVDQSCWWLHLYREMSLLELPKKEILDKLKDKEIILLQR